MASATPLRGELADQVRARFDPVLVVLSPPRSGSTALARAFWRHPAFRWYAHEPFDRAYHHDGGADATLTALRSPVAVADHDGNGLIVKEMTFQAGSHADELVAATDLPVVVTLRDPRLAVESRMRQRGRAGQEPSFPPGESGWRDLVAILRRLRAGNVRHVLVDTTRLRARPAASLEALCERIGLQYTPRMLDWPAADGIHLGQLADEQAHWYERVLRSSGLEPPTEEVPELSHFPAGMRDHVAACLAEYQTLLTDPEMLP